MEDIPFHSEFKSIRFLEGSIVISGGDSVKSPAAGFFSQILGLLDLVLVVFEDDILPIGRTTPGGEG